MNYKVCVIGAGNFGTAIAKMLAENVIYKKDYNQEILLWLYEEYIEGIPLSHIINTTHVNSKYLPNIKLPGNIKVTPNSEDIKKCDILIFVIPHQFIKSVLQKIKNDIKKTAIGISLIKGIMYDKGTIGLISEYISTTLDITCGVLMGANIATEIAKGYLSEGTLGIKGDQGHILYNLFNCNVYRVTVTSDVWGVELCGTLKNVVSLAFGICRGLGCSNNTCCAIVRNGVREIRDFYKLIGKGDEVTLFESCGISDVMVSCLTGRNAKCGEMLGEKKKLVEICESFGGQQLQGPDTAKEVYGFLKLKGKEMEFPLFSTVYRICFEDEIPSAIYCCISPQCINE